MAKENNKLKLEIEDADAVVNATELFALDESELFNLFCKTVLTNQELADSFRNALDKQKEIYVEYFGNCINFNSFLKATNRLDIDSILEIKKNMSIEYLTELIEDYTQWLQDNYNISTHNFNVAAEITISICSYQQHYNKYANDSIYLNFNTYIDTKYSKVVDDINEVKMGLLNNDTEFLSEYCDYLHNAWSFLTDGYLTAQDNINKHTIMMF